MVKRRTTEEWRQLLVFGFAGAFALVVLAIGVIATNTDPVDDNALTSEVEVLIPSRSATVELQQEVGIELDRTRNYQVQICVDGNSIPSDEYTAGDPSLGQFIFKPGEGRAVREWTQGAHEVVVGFWPASLPIEDAWPDSATCEPSASASARFEFWNFTAA
jgi:hypothetical protein